jgi:mono/diheme cytochrome c family protein
MHRQEGTDAMRIPSSLLLLALAALPAAAQTQTQALAQGRAVAEAWCANCHVVGSGSRTGSDAAPSFASIAQHRPNASALRIWLSQRHKDVMPNYALSRDEVDNVVAYILSLRQ